MIAAKLGGFISGIMVVGAGQNILLALSYGIMLLGFAFIDIKMEILEMRERYDDR